MLETSRIMSLLKNVNPEINNYKNPCYVTLVIDLLLRLKSRRIFRHVSAEFLLELENGEGLRTGKNHIETTTPFTNARY